MPVFPFSNAMIWQDLPPSNSCLCQISFRTFWRDFHHREGDAGTASSYVIQYPAPDNHRQEILEFVERVLIKESEKYADLAIFCSDGIAWSSKLILASASSFVKDLLSSVPNIDDTCLVLPHMTKVEFLTFQSALFSKDETQQSDMYSVIKGKSLSYDKFIWAHLARINNEIICLCLKCFFIPCIYFITCLIFVIECTVRWEHFE